MAEALKSRYGPEVAVRLADEVSAVWPPFDRQAFLADALQGYEPLELMPRGRHLAHALHRHLPQDYEAALGLLLASIEAAEFRAAAAAPGTHSPEQEVPQGALAPFFYLPHTEFVAIYGQGHLDASMRALHFLTQRFTGEFAIRSFLDAQPQAMLEQLQRWVEDPSAPVRRLVSEGTRPRLPWAPRLRRFGTDPQPVLALLERLRDDPAAAVRRSVANHLNDLGKSRPALLLDVARRWLAEPAGRTAERQQLVRHALRARIKAADPEVLALFGHGEAPTVSAAAVSIQPQRLVEAPGAVVQVQFELHNTGTRTQNLLVDLRVWYVKAAGHHTPKVFKVGRAELPPGASVTLGKRLSVAPLTTRRHHPGVHRIEAQVNGVVLPLGRFELMPP